MRQGRHDQNDINLGIVNVLAGFAPQPAEFIAIHLQQWRVRSHGGRGVPTVNPGDRPYKSFKPAPAWAATVLGEQGQCTERTTDVVEHRGRRLG